MKHAIGTKIQGNTITARSTGGPTLKFELHHGLTVAGQHNLAAQKYASRMGWDYFMAGGELPGGIWAHVALPSECQDFYNARAKSWQQEIRREQPSPFDELTAEDFHYPSN